MENHPSELILALSDSYADSVGAQVELAQEMLNASYLFMESKPLPVIGELSVGLEMLVAFDSSRQTKKTLSRIERSALIILSGHANQVWSKWSLSRNDYWGDARVVRSRISAEVDFWRGISAIGMKKSSIYLNWQNTLRFAMDCSDAVPYILAGITDFELIKTAVAEGIDVETALTLHLANPESVGSLPMSEWRRQ